MPQPQDEISIPGYQHPQCFARGLADCCLKISHEHTVSESVLTSIAGQGQGTVWRRNSPKQRDPTKPQQRDVGRMTAPILCVFHNNGLSLFDTEGGRMQNAMQAIYDERNGRPVTLETWAIDGDKLERWLLKAGLGDLYAGNLFAAPGQTLEGVCPPPHLLNILYRGADFPDRVGLYWNAEGVLDPRDWSDTGLCIGAIPTMDQRLVAAFRLVFFGINFYFPIVQFIPGDPIMVNGWYRPESLAVEGCQTQIAFTWKSGPKSAAVKVI
jgi:hypothetical protein